MASTVLYMSVSIDGVVAGPGTASDSGFDDNIERLHAWFLRGAGGTEPQAFDPGEGVNGRIFAEMLSTGAVVAGAGTFEPAEGWNGDHHDGVPMFIHSRLQPRIDVSGWPLVHYVEDVETAMGLAREAAGDRAVLVHGAAVAQLALAAGVLDELELHVVPVLLGRGRRLFDGLLDERVELERIRTLEGEHGVTHLRYRVLHPRRG